MKFRTLAVSLAEVAVALTAAPVVAQGASPAWPVSLVIGGWRHARTPAARIVKTSGAAVD